MITLIIFVLVLGFIVIIHELGHFYAARKNGVKVEEFGLGFPPKLFGIKRGETEYTINLIPLGGFVKIKGEDGSDSKDKDSFAYKKIWQRIVIVSAGVFMNVVLAMVLFCVGFMIGSPQIVDEGDKFARVKDEKIQIVQVLENSPADFAGFETGDQILKIDDHQFNDEEAVRQYISDNQEQELVFEIKRDDVEYSFQVKPEFLDELEKQGVGIAFAKTGLVTYPWYIAIWQGIKYTFLLMGAIIVAFYDLIKNLIIGHSTGMEVAGPVGIAVMTGQVARMGFVYLINFIALISLNLAIINFIPFPALDGGRVVFLIIEKIRKKPVSQKIENTIHTVGFALLMILIIWVTIVDVSKFKDVFTNFWSNLIN